MLDPAAPPGTSSPGLDRRALWLSVGGGTLSGLLFVGPALFAALTHTAVDMPLRHTGHELGDLLGLILVPLAVAALARRRPFLWCLLTLAICLCWTLTDRVVSGNWAGLVHDLHINTPVHAAPLLLICGPITLARWISRLRHEHAERARLNQIQAWNQPTPPAEGVWPPPPTRPPL